ncbi:MAG: glycine zipper 2TM domain-containing protein [Epsilonproteobacteria bacterium]|nr:hypothetical protein [Campylobacterota bacterium]NPA56974.1 glycine zipper 2TM domain-containing protein [Campylobacterota bacterium]
MRTSLYLIFTLLLIFFSGCASRGYTFSDTNRIYETRYGTVLEAQRVTIKAGEGGAAVGGIIGLIIGSQFGKGKGNVAAAVGGGLLGSLLGANTATEGQQLRIRLEDGRVITTVIKTDRTHYFRAGDRVKLILDGNKIIDIVLQ